MKTIIEGKANVCKLLGKQRVKDVQYRQMKYLLRVECDDGLLLHNVITGQLALLSPEEADLFDSLPAVRTSAIIALIEEYFLVPVDYNEKECVEKIRKALKQLYHPHKTNIYTVFTTTNCNARCYYCFESDYKRINMDAPTASRLVEYMIAHKGEGNIKIRWFGGEPLLEVARINQICHELKRHGIGFVSTMFSNAYLFTESLVKKAVDEWNLKSIQITLDGTEEVYNKIKAYVGAKESPYNRVIKNVHTLLKNNVYVKLRLNLDKSNMSDIRCLVDEICDRFSGFSNLHVYTHFIIRDTGFAPEKRSEEDDVVLHQKQVDMTKLLLRKGLVQPDRRLPSLQFLCCMADRRDTLAVYPDGRLFLCDIINEKDQASHINTNRWQESVIQKFQENVEFERCASCSLFPQCVRLKSCPGLESRNPATCSYDIEMMRDNMLFYYHNSSDERA